MKPGDSRRLWLGVVITADVLMMVCWWMAKNPFFYVFIGINSCVLIGEVVNAVWKKMTLSTETTKQIEGGGSKRIWVYCALFFMCLAIGSLVPHLVITGK